MPCFAPHQHFSTVGKGAGRATPAPLTPGPTAAIRRLGSLGDPVNGRGERTARGIRGERAAERRATDSGKEIA
ncbi:MAG: hypothetical protein JWP76_6021 [Dactylosporangium sp.]|jgi:hypothetical protein|nr:hypothetical protein [Dactylosporangium sp.]